MTSFEACIKLYEWLKKQPKINIREYEQDIKQGTTALLCIQGDGRCHVRVKDIYERVELRELSQLMQGNYKFVEEGCYSDEAKKTLKELAELLPKVKRWVITAYPEDRGIVVDAIELGDFYIELRKSNKIFLFGKMSL